MITDKRENMPRNFYMETISQISMMYIFRIPIYMLDTAYGVEAED